MKVSRFHGYFDLGILDRVHHESILSILKAGSNLESMGERNRWLGLREFRAGELLRDAIIGKVAFQLGKELASPRASLWRGFLTEASLTPSQRHLSARGAA